MGRSFLGKRCLFPQFCPANQIMSQSYTWRTITLSKGPLSIYKWIIPMVIHHLRSGMILQEGYKAVLGKIKTSIPVGQPSTTFTNLVGSPWWGFNMAKPRGFNPRSLGSHKRFRLQRSGSNNLDVWWQNHQFWWRQKTMNLWWFWDSLAPWSCTNQEVHTLSNKPQKFS